MEIKAIIEALQYIQANQQKHTIIETDSMLTPKKKLFPVHRLDSNHH